MPYPRILVATLTSRKKDYCFTEFFSRINNLSYPHGYDLMVSDNSEDSKYKEYLKKFFPNVRHIPNTKSMPWTEILAKSHNQIRDFFLENNYDILIHIESDVIPPHDVIERLLYHKKSVVCGAYFHGIGPSSWVLAYEREGRFNYVHAPSKIDNLGSDIYRCDGKLREVYICGLGCALIHKSVLKKVAFRSVPGYSVAPDGFFFDDLLKNTIRVWQDTSILCEHYNTNWGENPSWHNKGVKESKAQMVTIL